MVSYLKNLELWATLEVLILIVMDNGLLLCYEYFLHGWYVLILIVMDNGLLRDEILFGGGTPAGS